MAETVYWADLQNELSKTGLNVELSMPKPGYPWFGNIDGKPFTMTIPPKNRKDGIRDFMVISLFGQEEETVVPLLSKFMGYSPFCKYLHKVNPTASATYEWDRKEPGVRLGALKEDNDIHELQRFEEGFKPPVPPGVEEFYQQFTPEIVTRWREALEKNPNAEWAEIRIRDILPFVEKVMPRVGRNQSLFGLSIVSLDGKIENEAEVVRYGLDPLIKAGILTNEEAEKILSWYQNTQPTWHSGGAGHFTKEFELGGVKYRLITDSYRNCRDLNLQVLAK